MHAVEGAANAAGKDKIQALKEAAKHLVSLGYGVIQTGGGGDPKRPLKRNWNRDIATTPEAIDSWEWPDERAAGIAIVPFGRVVALDLDAPNKDEKRPSPEVELCYNYLLSRFPELANAWREKTPNGGYHIVVRVGPSVNTTKLKKTAEGPYGVKIELKGWQKASLVVAPTEVDGKPYEIKHGPVSVASLPEMGKEFFEHEYVGLLPKTKAAPKKRVSDESLAGGLVESLLHEAFQIIENAVKGDRNNSVFRAFLNLGRAKSYLGDRFEAVWNELYEKAKEKLLAPDFPERELRAAAENGLRYGERIPIPALIGKDYLHHGRIAEFVLAEKGGDLCYVEELGWFVWNGRYWQPRDKKRGITGIIHGVMMEKIKVWREALDPANEGYAEWLNKLEGTLHNPVFLGRVQMLLEQLDVYGIQKSLKEMPKPDEIKHLLPVANGVLDLTTGELHPHEKYKDKMFFAILDTPYDPTAKAPHFEAAMRTWFAGDAELIDFVQRVLGSFLTGDVSAQKMYIFYGKTANGKSTLLRIEGELLGDFAVRVPSDLFKKNKRDPHPAQIMTLYRKRLAYCPDFPDKTPLDEEIIKAQTGDTLSARPMYENYREFEPTHKAVIATNDLPKVTSSKEAVFRRIIPIPFRVSFNNAKRADPHFIEKLRREKAGILRWHVEGAKMYLSDPLRQPPKSVGDLWEAYKTREDIVASFVAACVEQVEGAAVSRKELYEAFKRYCEEMGLSPITANSFTRRFRELLKPSEITTSGERKYLNIRVREEWQNIEERTSLEEISADELPASLFSVPKEPELPLYIEETAKAGERLQELFAALSQSEVKPLRRLSLYLRGLQALTYAEIGAYNGAIMYLGGTPKHTTPTPKEALGVLQQVIQDIEGSLNGEEVALAPLPIPPQSGGRTALPIPPTPEIAEKHRAIEEIRRAIRELERAIKGDDPTDPTPTDPDPTPPSPIGTDPTPNLPPREGEPKWEYVTDASQLPEIEERLQREDAVGWDLETVGHPGTIGGALHPATGRARLFSLYLPTLHTAYLIDLDRVPEAWGLLAKAKKIVGHNLLFDLTFAAAYGAYIANPKERLWDTMIAEKLLDCKEYSEPRRHSLKELASKLGIWLNKEHQTANWGGPLTDEMRRYAAMDAYAPYLVYLSQRERIAKEGLGKAMAIEMGALPAIAAMRAWGVGVDGEAVKRDWDAHLTEVRELEKELEPYGREVEPSLTLGEPPNWNRLELIKKVLHRQGLPADETNEEALAPYKDHPFVATLLKWREVTKRGKFLAGLLEPARRGGRIYADWEPLGAGTGRMTCKAPNLQQTPHELRAHIKPREGHVFIKADFSQIELRIAAVMAPDQRMLQAFRDGTDLHTLTASLILSKETKQVSKEERQMAKALNFGLLYGMGPEGLKNNAQSEYGVSLSLEQATEYRERFFTTYPGLAKWHRETERKLIEAKNRGERGIVVSTLAGRQRWVYVKKLTAALNTPIQGTGADGLKSAVAVFYKWLLERGLWGQVRIVLLVHDEIVVEAPEPLALEATYLLTEAMREGMGAIVNKAVPIEVEAGIYADWGQTPHRLNEAWGRFAKIPVGHPVREAILKGGSRPRTGWGVLD
jgi:DNA polymerase-1